MKKLAKSNIDLDFNIKNIYSINKGNYGYPRIYKELKATNISCSKNRVYRRMKILNLKAKTARKFKVTTDSNHKLPINSNVLNRDFSTTSINQKWVGDITYIHTKEGWLYLATVMDLYSRAIIGWSMDKNINKELVCNALNMAVTKRKNPTNVIMHTDRGSQYCSKIYQSLIKLYRFVPSMSRKGNCWDNSVAESFFKTLKSELVYDCNFRSREEAKNEIFDYIERYYNKSRRHSAIDYKAPYEVEYNLLNAA